MNKIKLMAFKALFIILSLLLSQQAFALKCLPGDVHKYDATVTNNLLNTTNTGDIKIIETDDKGLLVWRAFFSTTLTCFDDAGANKSENINMYLDETTKDTANYFSDKDISVGIIYNGQEYIIDGTRDSIDTEIQAIKEVPVSTKEERAIAKANCDRMKLGWTATRCAQELTVTLNYTLFLKSKSDGGHIKEKKLLKIFQMDGVNGRNTGGNFSEFIQLGDVNYIDCVPQPTSQIVNLGGYYVDSNLNVTLERIPFKIEVITKGEQCATEVFKAALSAVSTIDNKTIQTTTNGVGIQLFEPNGTEPLILESFNGENEILFGKAEGNGLISKNLEAGVIFKSKPDAGEFTGTVNYQLWIK